MNAPVAAAAIGHNLPPLPVRLAEDYAHLTPQADEIAALANAAPARIDDEESLIAVGEIVKEAAALRRRAEGAHKEEKAPHLEAGRVVDGFFKVFTERMKRIEDTLAARANDYGARKRAEEKRRADELARKQREEEDRQREIARKAEEAGRLAAAAKALDKADVAADRAAAAQAQAKAPDPFRVRGENVAVSATTKWVGEIVDFDAIDLNALRAHFDVKAIDDAVKRFVKLNRNTRPLAGVRIVEDVRTNFR